LSTSGVPAAVAAALLVGFGAAYNVHALVQARMFAREGSVAVGLANAVRCVCIGCTAFSAAPRCQM